VPQDPMEPDLVEDEIPEPPADPVAKLGDVWQVGPHRIVCGDSTDPAIHELLMAEHKADLIWTDPPYGVDYVGKTKDKLTIKNDGAQGLEPLLKGTFGCLSRSGKEGAAIYVAHPPGVLSKKFIDAFVEAGWRLHQTLIWDKGSIALGHSDYHYSHEPILYGYLTGGGRRGRGGAGWYGDNSQKSVFAIQKPARNSEHPTMKPIELIVKCVENSSPRDGIVLDPFAGSGSTLIAAARTGRIGYGIELDPGYVDVIIKRLETETGQTATLIGNPLPGKQTKKPSTAKTNAYASDAAASP